MLLTLTALLVTSVYALYLYFTRTFNYWKDKNVVGPEPLPLVGNLKDSAFRRKIISVVLKELYDRFPDEKVIGIFRMTSPCLLIRDLDVIKNVMIKDFDVFADRGVEFSKEGLGANLFHADGDTWRVLRNRFTPLFTSGKLRNMFYLMNERGDNFVDYINSICVENPEQEIHQLVQKYTVSTISACAFGLDIDLKKDKFEELKFINDTVFRQTYLAELDMMFPNLMKKFNASFFPKALSQYFHDLVTTVIKQRNGMPTNRKDFMDLILEIRQQKEIHGTKRRDNANLSLELTESVIAAQAFIFYVAGYETSATTMAFMLHQLAVNPDIQDKLIAEIDEVLQRNDGQVSYESLKEMSYMTQVFDETLRMYPLVDLQRKAQVDYKIPDTTVTVKKGQMIIVTPLGIHHDEKHYPNPKKFDPERFNVENSRDRHPCAYLPFGVGPRNCIGMRFAQIQSRVCIAKFLSNFRVEPSRKTRTVLEFDPNKPIVTPCGGLHLNIVPRK